VNLANGDVEVLAAGTAQAINTLAEWLEQGPPAARVSDVSAADIDVFDASDFRTG
jgi:acylphosphatase